MVYQVASRRPIPGPVQSLKQIASHVVSTHLTLLTDIGDLSYSLVEPFLSECKAEQLAELELASPHIKKDSKILWKRLTLKDFFEFRIAYEKGDIKEPRNWRKAYIATHEARQIKEQERRQRLKDSYAALENQRQERKLVFSNKLAGDKVKKSRFSTDSAPRSTSASILSKARSQTKSYAQNFRLPRSTSRPNGCSTSTSTPSQRTFPHTPSVLTDARESGMMTKPNPPAKRFVIDPSKPRLIDRRPVYVPPKPEEKPPNDKIVVDFFNKGPTGEKKGGTPIVVKTIIKQRVSVAVSPQSPPSHSSASPPFSRAPRPPNTVYSPPSKGARSVDPPPAVYPTPLAVQTTDGPAGSPPAPQPVRSRPPKRKEVSLFIPNKKKKRAVV